MLGGQRGQRLGDLPALQGPVQFVGGRHVAPTFAGDTLYAWSEVLETSAVRDRADVGALRIRTIALKDRSADGFPGRKADGSYEDGVVLDLDYWAILPR
mgnify:CR=1 FL=1